MGDLREAFEEALKKERAGAFHIAFKSGFRAAEFRDHEHLARNGKVRPATDAEIMRWEKKPCIAQWWLSVTEVTLNCLFPLDLAPRYDHTRPEAKHKEMSYKQWKFDWLCSGPLFAPTCVALARMFEGDELKGLIEYHGTPQKCFYTIRRFRQGVRSKATGRFTLEGAMAAAEDARMG